VTDIQAPPDGTNRLFVLERAGRVVVFERDPTASQKTPFLDVRGQVDTQGEGGLLGLAFHPDYAQNGWFFVYYTTSQNGPFRSVVSRFTVSAPDPDSADPNSEQVVLTAEQPYSNHNAGQLQFGPDGSLYVGLGDGGSGGDPEEHGQDPTTLLGSMLRLDVDLDGSGTMPECGSGAYEIPSTNPFVDADDDRCDEIYAYGFRNPYRYSFGPEGRLWVADVGQNNWEEIDWVEAGGNYGWDVMEGTHCYEPSSGCDTAGLELPVFEYSHSEGSSITGGYVYEGSCGYIDGRYIYGDYGSGRIWALPYDDSGTGANELLLDSSLSLTTFGVGPEDELYFAGIFDDALYQFVCSTLPVELTTFDAEVDDGTVRLTWQTASETGNAGFRVQRHVTGTGAPETQGHGGLSGWTTVGRVEGAGTTSEAQSYRFADANFPHAADTLLYRLKQVDTDGSTYYSETITVARRRPARLHLLGTAPNPARRRTTVRYAVPESASGEAARLELYDVMGRRVRSVEAPADAGRHKRSLDVRGLASGVYVLRLQVSGDAQTRTLTVAR
jgi:Glucose/sorbosone dehydrogenases